MKKCLLACGLFVVGFTVFAQGTVKYEFYNNAPAEILERIQACDSLIEQKKYASANGALGENDNEYIIYKRVELYTQYFVQSMMHTMFVIEDLDPKEDLMELRRNYNGNANMIFYEVENVIADFEKINGKSPVLNLALANFYFDVYHRYGDQWLKTTDELLSLAKENYEIAFKSNICDSYACFAYGTICVGEQNYEKGLEFFLKRVEFEPEDAKALFNIAVCAINLENYELSATFGYESIKYEVDPEYKADGYTISAESYMCLDQKEKAFEIIEEGKKNCKTSVDVFMTAGSMYLYNQEYAKAEKDFIAAIKLVPNVVVDCCENVASFSNSNNDWKYFNSFCLKVVKLYPDDLDYTIYTEFMLCQSYFMIGKQDLCLKECAKLRKIGNGTELLESYSLEELEAACQK